MKINAKNFFSNRLVLHIVFAISFFMILCFILSYDLASIIFFLFVGIITSYFSKNMIIVLAVPILVVGCFSINKMTTSLNQISIEGFEGNQSAGQGAGQGPSGGSNRSHGSGSHNNSNSSQRRKVAAKRNHNQQENYSSRPSQSNSNTNNTSAYNTKGLTNQPKSKDKQKLHADEKMSNSESFDIINKKKTSDIDYAATIENAYDDLNNILGGDGIQKLTSDTQNLVSQQAKLAEAMAGMKPLIDGISPLVEQVKGLGILDNGMDLESLTKMIPKKKTKSN
jgi:hypothetical protein